MLLFEKNNYLIWSCVGLYNYTGCFTSCVHYCRKWFPRSLWSKKFVETCVRFWTVTQLWPF